MTRKPDELGEQIRAIREEVVMKTLSVTLIAGSVLLLGNMARNLHLGNPLSIVYPFLYLVALTFYLTRRRIGAQRIAWLTVILLYLAATAGMLVYGLAGNSAAVYMAFCFVSTTFFGVRGGAAAAAAASVRVMHPSSFPGFCWPHDWPARKRLGGDDSRIGSAMSKSRRRAHRTAQFGISEPG